MTDRRLLANANDCQDSEPPSGKGAHSDVIRDLTSVTIGDCNDMLVYTHEQADIGDF